MGGAGDGWCILGGGWGRGLVEGTSASRASDFLCRGWHDDKRVPFGSVFLGEACFSQHSFVRCEPHLRAVQYHGLILVEPQ